MLYLLATNTCFGLACPITDPKSYADLYTIKQRAAEKAISLMVPNFEWLAENTTLTSQQINFLKTYDHPFTILTQSPLLEKKIKELQLFNAHLYQMFALRVAHTLEQHDLINQVGIIFLTSANLSNQGEIYEVNHLRTVFQKEIQDGSLKEFGILEDLKRTSPSQIFAFEGESLKQIFFRS